MNHSWRLSTCSQSCDCYARGDRHDDEGRKEGVAMRVTKERSEGEHEFFDFIGFPFLFFNFQLLSLHRIQTGLGPSNSNYVDALGYETIINFNKTLGLTIYLFTRIRGSPHIPCGFGMQSSRVMWDGLLWTILKIFFFKKKSKPAWATRFVGRPWTLVHIPTPKYKWYVNI